MKGVCILLLFISLPVLSQEENVLVALDTKGHQGLVKNVCFSPDGSLLYSISDDKTARVWNVEHGRLLYTYRGYIEMDQTGMLNSGAINPSGELLAVGGYLGQGDNAGDIRVHETYTGEILGTLVGHTTSVVALQFDPVKDYLYSGANDGTIGIWNLENSKGVIINGHTDGAYGLTISPDGNKLLSTSYDGTAVLWDIRKILKKNEVIYEVLEQKHTAEIRNCAFSPDGKYFVTVGYDNRILLWDSKGEFIKEIDKIMDPNYGEKYGVGDINCVAFSGDGSKIVIGTNLTTEENAIVYSIPEGDKLRTFKGHNNAVISCDFYGENLIATAGGNDREIIIWDANTGETLHILKGTGKRIWELSVGPNYEIAFGQEPGARQVLNQFGEVSKTFSLQSFELGELPEDMSEFTSEVLSRGDLSIDFTNAKPNIVSMSNGNVIELSPGIDGGMRCMSLAPDDNVVVGASFRTCMWNQEGEKIKEFVGHTAEVYALAFSHDGKFMFTGSGDQTIKIWDLSDEGTLSMTEEEFRAYLVENYGEETVNGLSDEKILEIYEATIVPDVTPVASLFVGSDNEWICWTNDNYYATSQFGSRFVGFHINKEKDKAAKFYEFEQFDIVYNRPDKVLKKLGTGTDDLENAFERAYFKRIDKLNYNLDPASDKNFNAPKLELNMEPMIVTEPVIKLKFNMMDNQEYLSQIFITNNDVPTTGKDGRDFYGVDSTNYLIYSVDEPLVPGENKFQLWCVNSAGVRSNRETVRIYYETDDVKPNLYILGLGASEYENEKMNLKYAEKDVRDFVNFYSENKNYGTINIDTLFNENITIENIKLALGNLQNSTINDHLIIYIAGHGILDANLDYYLATYNINFENPAENGLSYAFMEDILDQIPARTKTLFMDACHSGEIDKEEVEIAQVEASSDEDIQFRSVGNTVKAKSGIGYNNSFKLMKTMFTDLREQSGATIIASAGGGEFAFEGDEWNNGVFTYALLNGLKSGDADLNGDGDIYLSEIRKYLIAAVSEMTNGQQEPISRSENITNDYVFWSE